jgi:plasmid stability protein
MGQVLIRNIGDDVVAGLKTKARISGVSFETFLRDQLTALAPLTGDQKLRLLQDFHRKHGSLAAVTAPEEIIGRARDERSDPDPATS